MDQAFSQNTPMMNKEIKYEVIADDANEKPTSVAMYITEEGANRMASTIDTDRNPRVVAREVI